MLELIVGVLLAAGAAYYVLLPVLRPPAPLPAGRADAGAADDEGDDPADDLSPQAVALRALKEIEFDRATGKLSDADYAALKRKYEGAALAALRGEPGAGSREQRIAPAPRSPLPAPVCPVHGVRPEIDAAFCAVCGRRVGTAPAYCIRCGSALESDARYCNRCGSRVAA